MAELNSSETTENLVNFCVLFYEIVSVSVKFVTNVYIYIYIRL